MNLLHLTLTLSPSGNPLLITLYSTPATSASRFLRHTGCTPASWPLHWLVPTPDHSPSRHPLCLHVANPSILFRWQISPMPTPLISLVLLIPPPHTELLESCVIYLCIVVNICLYVYFLVCNSYQKESSGRLSALSVLFTDVSQGLSAWDNVSV